MKAKSYIQYKDASGKINILTIWLQNIDMSRVENGHIKLLLSTNEDGTPRVTTNNNNIEQYSFNELVKDGAFTFISLEQAKIIKALGLAIELDGEVWVKLPVYTSIPDFMFNSAPKWS